MLMSNASSNAEGVPVFVYFMKHLMEKGSFWYAMK